MNHSIDYRSIVRNNILKINQKIERAAIKSGRTFADIQVVPVTKNIPQTFLQLLQTFGYDEFAESKVQELNSKYHLDRDIKWHFIGHLQSNKIKHIIDKVQLIHSVDTIKLAKALNERAKKNNIKSNILLQLNISGELSKHGFVSKEILYVLDEIQNLQNIYVHGIMTMAPKVDNPEKIRSIFSEMKRISLDIQSEKFNNVAMDILSMGMSSDYEMAIEEGSNLVRIGSAFFNGLTNLNHFSS